MPRVSKGHAEYVMSSIFEAVTPIHRLYIKPDMDTLTFVNEKRGGCTFDTTDGSTVTIVNNFWDYFDVTVKGRDGSTISITEDEIDDPQTLPNAWNVGDRVVEMLVAANSQ